MVQKESWSRNHRIFYPPGSGRKAWAFKFSSNGNGSPFIAAIADIICILALGFITDIFTSFLASWAGDKMQDYSRMGENGSTVLWHGKMSLKQVVMKYFNNNCGQEWGPWVPSPWASYRRSLVNGKHRIFDCSFVWWYLWTIYRIVKDDLNVAQLFDEGFAA